MVMDVGIADAGLPAVAGADPAALVGAGVVDGAPVVDGAAEPQAATSNTSAAAAAAPAALRRTTQATLMTTSFQQFRSDDATLRPRAPTRTFAS